VRIIGIDPGFGILGWAVTESDQRLIDFGAIHTDTTRDIGKRIYDIHQSLEEIIQSLRPESAAVERLFFTKNVKTGIEVAKTIGAVILTLKLKHIEYAEYSPSQVKRALTGYGRAEKFQMMQMVKAVFKLNEIPQPDDAADAIAVALCHALQTSSAVKISGK